MTYTIEQLTSIGGREWQVDDKHRVYFNGLLEFCEGLEYSTNRQGRFRHAVVDGKLLPTREGFRILGMLNTAKFYYDVTTGRFEGGRIPADYVERVVRGLQRRLDEVGQ